MDTVSEKDLLQVECEERMKESIDKMRFNKRRLNCQRQGRLYLAAASASDMKDWMGHVRKAIRKAASSSSSSSSSSSAAAAAAAAAANQKAPSAAANQKASSVSCCFFFLKTGSPFDFFKPFSCL